MAVMEMNNQMSDLLGEETHIPSSSPSPLPVETPLDDLNIDDYDDLGMIEDDVEEAPSDEIIPDLIKDSMYPT